jgi:hypothetical protein
MSFAVRFQAVQRTYDNDKARQKVEMRQIEEKAGNSKRERMRKDEAEIDRRDTLSCYLFLFTIQNKYCLAFKVSVRWSIVESECTPLFLLLWANFLQSSSYLFNTIAI